MVQGKVCLSLLGTWNSGDESEKWGPHSSIFQIVMSILNQLLVPDPYYAEPVLISCASCAFH